MTEKLYVPDIGDFKDVEIIEVLVKPGDKIKKNDPIVTLESDKSRNWEGMVRLEESGFLIITDKYPRMIFAYVNLK